MVEHSPNIRNPVTKVKKRGGVPLGLASLTRDLHSSPPSASTASATAAGGAAEGGTGGDGGGGTGGGGRKSKSKSKSKGGQEFANEGVVSPITAKDSQAALGSLEALWATDDLDQLYMRKYGS